MSATPPADTPRTNAQSWRLDDEALPSEVVLADFARELEREIATLLVAFPLLCAILRDRKVGDTVDGLDYDIDYNDGFRLAIAQHYLSVVGPSEYIVLRLP